MTLPFGAVTLGDPRLPAAVIAHGSASTAAFVGRVFSAPLSAAGFRLVTWDRRTPPDSADGELAEIAGAVEARVVGGISVGALLAARYAVAGHDALDGLLLALPPWLGTPDEAAALSAAAAAEVAAHGLDDVLDRMSEGAVHWVADEVAQAWRAWVAVRGFDGLVAELRAAAAMPGPGAQELASLDVPTGIVAFVEDPLHPLTSAQAWAQALPRAALITIEVGAPATDRGVIGSAAVTAWQASQACHQ